MNMQTLETLTRSKQQDGDMMSVSIYHDVRVIMIIIVISRGGDSYQDEAVREEDGHADHQDDRPQQEHRQHRVGLRPEQQQYNTNTLHIKYFSSDSKYFSTAGTLNLCDRMK